MGYTYYATLSGIEPDVAGRVIFDSNVIGPAVDWLIGRKSAVPESVVAPLQWVADLAQRRRLVPARFGRLPLKADGRAAMLEKSRAGGVVSGSDLAARIAALDTVMRWLNDPDRLGSRFASRPPRLEPSRDGAGLDGQNQFEDQRREVFAILSLAVAIRDISATKSTGERLELLQKWGERVGGEYAQSSFLVVAAVDAAFGSTSSFVAMLKFAKMAKPGCALAVANNAAWDLQFVRDVSASELGESWYENDARRTVLLTFDRSLAAAMADVRALGAQRADGHVKRWMALDIEGRLSKNNRTRDEVRLGVHAWLEEMHRQGLARGPVPDEDGHLEHEIEQLVHLIEHAH